jgi:hypothetical protein
MMILTMILQDNMEKKITSLRALIQERVKALQEKQPVKSAASVEKKPLIQSRMKELMEKAKQARKENKGTPALNTSLREKMLAQREQIKTIINKQQIKNKEVSHE